MNEGRGKTEKRNLKESGEIHERERERNARKESQDELGMSSMWATYESTNLECE